MKKFVALIGAVLLVSSAGIALARVNPGSPSPLCVTQSPTPGYLEDDLRVRALGSAKTDTLVFGYYTTKPHGLTYALLGGEWNFDPVAEDPLEGWTSVDQTDNDRAYWRQLTAAKWIAEGGSLPWPAMTGNGMALCGATQGRADTLSWVNGVGYGNNWCQRLVSPTLTYDGTGTVDLSLQYFSECEPNFDLTKIFVEAAGGRILLNSPGFTGKIGIDTLGVLTPANYAQTISNLDLGGGTDPHPFQVVIEFVSDGGVSDEDGDSGFDTFYGGVGVDDISLEGANLVPPVTLVYGFEADLQGWVAATCPGIGSFLGLSNMGDYIITDPCSCPLLNNVLEMHNAEREHPTGQHEALYTPIIDRENDIPGGTYLSYNRIMAEWDQYSDLPAVNGVYYRAGWTYYPYENPHVPGMIQWSPRVGIETFYYEGDVPSCDFNRNIGTDWGLPADAKKVRFIYEIYASCEAFGQVPCSGLTNFTPLLDNITVRNVGYVAAPVALFEPGTRFQDGFGQDPIGIASPTDPGNADVAFDLHHSTAQPTRLGDSLVVAGPGVTGPAARWEAKLWFRLKRTGPGQYSPLNPGLAAFAQWRSTVAGHKGDFYTGPNPSFAWGYMDSVEVPTALRNVFCSQFRESNPGGGLAPEPCFNWGGGTGDQGEENEILPDGVFTPGTKVEYFVTTNYLSTPTAYYFYPDTVGGTYQEFEILPSYRSVGGVDKFPCVLYVDAFNGGTQPIIEDALHAILNGGVPSEPIPDPTKWDRYDYLDASSNWNGSIYRMLHGNGGATIPQLIGYKFITVTTGTASADAMEPRDWQGFQQWLDAVICSGNLGLQGFIADGTSIGEIIDTDYPYLLNNSLGAIYRCRSYAEFGCDVVETFEQNDTNDCVRVEQAPGSPLGAGIAMDVFGNWCPDKIPFNVLGTTGSGFGSRVYEKIGRTDSYQTRFAQIVNDVGAGGPNYRSVVQSSSYDRLIERGTPEGPEECHYDTVEEEEAARRAAVSQELEDAIKWTLNITDPLTQVGFCVNPCFGSVDDVSEPGGTGGFVTRLFQNRPNPFNPRTAIRFSLAAAGPADLVIYDVNGRRVRTLIDQVLPAGVHEAFWDGLDDAGHPVTAGVYWSQLQAGSYASNKKMVVLK